MALVCAEVSGSVARKGWAGFPVSPSGSGNTRAGKGTLLVPSSGTGTWKGKWLFYVYYLRYYYEELEGNMPT